jgi:hypothetical protein
VPHLNCRQDENKWLYKCLPLQCFVAGALFAW